MSAGLVVTVIIECAPLPVAHPMRHCALCMRRRRPRVLRVSRVHRSLIISGYLGWRIYGKYKEYDRSTFIAADSEARRQMGLPPVDYNQGPPQQGQGQPPGYSNPNQGQNMYYANR